MNAKIESVRNSETLSIRKQKDIIINNLTHIFSDLTFLANQQDLTRISDSISMTGRRFLGIDFKLFLESKSVYDQIRFINPEGMEMVRANFNSGSPAIVSADQLQSKKHRYYFTKTVSWQKSEVFISPMDLNMEHGEIEIPRKPVIRFGTPVINDAGENRGLVMLSYLGNTLINEFTATSSKRQSEFMLLNSEGYWLISPCPEDDWAFMYDERLHRTFGNDHPQAWEKYPDLNQVTLLRMVGCILMIRSIQENCSLRRGWGLTLPRKVFLHISTLESLPEKLSRVFLPRC